MSGYTSAAALARPETRGYIKIHGECGRKKWQEKKGKQMNIWLQVVLPLLEKEVSSQGVICRPPYPCRLLRQKLQRPDKFDARNAYATRSRDMKTFPDLPKDPCKSIQPLQEKSTLKKNLYFKWKKTVI